MHFVNGTFPEREAPIGTFTNVIAEFCEHVCLCVCCGVMVVIENSIVAGLSLMLEHQLWEENLLCVQVNVWKFSTHERHKLWAFIIWGKSLPHDADSPHEFISCNSKTKNPQEASDEISIEMHDCVNQLSKNTHFSYVLTIQNINNDSNLVNIVMPLLVFLTTGMHSLAPCRGTQSTNELIKIKRFLMTVWIWDNFQSASHNQPASQPKFRN